MNTCSLNNHIIYIFLHHLYSSTPYLPRPIPISPPRYPHISPVAGYPDDADRIHLVRPHPSEPRDVLGIWHDRVGAQYQYTQHEDWGSFYGNVSKGEDWGDWYARVETVCKVRVEHMKLELCLRNCNIAWVGDSRGGGVQARNFWKVDFELWVGGHGQDMFQQLEGGFGSINPLAAHVRPWSKKWTKKPKFKKLRQSSAFNGIRFVSPS